MPAVVEMIARASSLTSTRQDAAEATTGWRTRSSIPRRLWTEAGHGASESEFVTAASRETVLALLTPEEAAGFSLPQSREDGTVAHTSSESRGVWALRHEEEDA